MRNWWNYYSQRLSTPREAIGHIRDGDHIVLGSCCSESQTLVEALMEEVRNFHDLRVFSMIQGSSCPYAEPALSEHIKLLTILPVKKVYAAFDAGQAYFLPYRLSEVPRGFREGDISVDITFIQVSPPNEQGYCSLGISVDYLPAAIERSRLVIAQVNDQMPFTLGDAVIPVEDIDLFVESSRPLLTFTPKNLQDATLQRVAQNVASLVPDGATIQLGVGALPETVTAALKDKQDLGVHSGMITDGIVELVEKGVITNRFKPIDRGKIVTALMVGTERLYRWVDHNPLVIMRPADYTHNADVLAQIDNLVAINAALQVDLTGQVNAETLNGKQIGAIGGQSDFVTGARRAANGKAIIALASSAQHDQISRIVPRLGEGEAVTTYRSDVEFVVTEYGVASLRGKTVNDRAKEMVKIVHPKFREELEVERRKMYPD